MRMWLGSSSSHPIFIRFVTFYFNFFICILVIRKILNNPLNLTLKQYKMFLASCNLYSDFFTWHCASAWGEVTSWQGETQSSAFCSVYVEFGKLEGGVERSTQWLQPEAQLQADWIWVAVLLLGSILCNSTGQFCLTCKKVTWITCLNLII